MISLQWPAATDNRLLTRYVLTRDIGEVAEIPAEAEPLLTVTQLAEFTEYTFEVAAVDKAGNTSVPLPLTIRTADATAPVWDEGCELTWDVAIPDDLDAGIEFSWCEVTDNDRVDHLELRKGSAIAAVGKSRYGITEDAGPPVVIPTDQLHHVRKLRPLDGTYTVAACDPSGNCAELPPVRVELESLARKEAMMNEVIASSSLLAALIGTTGEYSADSLFGGADLWDDSVLSGTDFSGVTGLAVAGEGMGGLGSRGSAGGGGGYRGGGGGGGAAVGVGSLGTGRSSTYRAASASLKPGGQAALAAHVARRMSRIQHCYSQARAVDRDLKGSLTIRLSADAEGAITVDGVSGPETGGLTSCAAGSLRGHLTEPPGEAVAGTFTVTLDPGSA